MAQLPAPSTVTPEKTRSAAPDPTDEPDQIRTVTVPASAECEPSATCVPAVPPNAGVGLLPGVAGWTMVGAGDAVSTVVQVSPLPPAGASSLLPALSIATV